jgi:hypothetical protein
LELRQPDTQRPLPSKRMVRPLNGTWTGTFAARVKISVRLCGTTLPPS